VTIGTLGVETVGIFGLTIGTLGVETVRILCFTWTAGVADAGFKTWVEVLLPGWLMVCGSPCVASVGGAGVAGSTGVGLAETDAVEEQQTCLFGESKPFNELSVI
jgi:hypothetical protein